MTRLLEWIKTELRAIGAAAVVFVALRRQMRTA